MFNIEWLIYPCEKSHFFSEIWQKECSLLSSQRPDYFNELFDELDLERLLEYGQPKPPSIKFASHISDKKVVPTFDEKNGRLNIDELRKNYLQGQTIIVNSVENFDPKVARLIQSMQKEMGFKMQANAYLTPPSSQGFSPHYDTHDVIVLQIEGNKLWRVYGKDNQCPLNEMTDGGAFLLEGTEPPLEINLKTGDVLYIPRGRIHEAETSKMSSLHLTIGIHPVLGKDLLNAALECACHIEPKFREPIPIGIPSKDVIYPEIKKFFMELIDLFSKTASIEMAVEVIEDEFLRCNRSAGDGHLFSDAYKLLDIDVNSEIVRRPNIHCRLVKMDQGVALRFLGSLIKCPAEFEPAIRFVMKQSDPFKVMNIPGINSAYQVALATSLITDGLCRFADKPESVVVSGLNRTPTLSLTS